MSKFILQPSSAIRNSWIVEDLESGICCVFDSHAFNETQEFSFDNFRGERSAERVAKIAREMGDWLGQNAYYIAMPMKDDKIDLYVGQQVSVIRQSKEMTRYRLAKLAGLREYHIAQIERGETSPSARILAKIAKVLDCDFLLR